MAKTVVMASGLNGIKVLSEARRELLKDEVRIKNCEKWFRGVKDDYNKTTDSKN